METQEIIKTVLTVEELTTEQIRKENREYNPSEWDKVINRFSSYAECKFYIARAQRGYAYDRYFASYRTPEGILFFKSVSYSSSITSNGFVKILILNGKVSRMLFKQGDKIGRMENAPNNRKLMAEWSKHGLIFSNEF
jgi:hypothetical protein